MKRNINSCIRGTIGIMLVCFAINFYRGSILKWEFLPLMAITIFSGLMFAENGIDKYLDKFTIESKR